MTWIGSPENPGTMTAKRRTHMRDTNRFVRYALLVSLFLLLAGIGTTVQAQDQGRMIIEATAMGTSTQLGKMVHIVIHIDKYSTQEDRKTLINAFDRSGQDGLVRALQDMKEKGRIRTPYGVGNDIKYIIELPPEKGRRHIRLITDRTIAFAEAYAGTRSMEYSLGAVDLFLTPDGKGSEGRALPACKLKVNKKKQQLEIETYQNPWKLTNIRVNR
jgi:hypothetical protein